MAYDLLGFGVASFLAALVASCFHGVFPSPFVLCGFHLRLITCFQSSAAFLARFTASLTLALSHSSLVIILLDLAIPESRVVGLLPMLIHSVPLPLPLGVILLYGKKTGLPGIIFDNLISESGTLVHSSF